jgi:hypothetical protein
MTARRSPSTPVNADIKTDPKFFMLDGITAEENELLQSRARAAVAQLYRRQIKHPARLLADFRAALRREGFVRVQAKSWCEGIKFKANLGHQFRSRKLVSEHEVAYGAVTRAARQSGLDPRFEDVWIHLEGSRVEGCVSAVPFVLQEKAVDQVVTKWACAKQALSSRLSSASTPSPSWKRRSGRE